MAIATVSDLMVRFNIPLEEASGFMDTLMATSQETGIPIRELQSALDGAGTQLSAMGYSLEESVAMLGAFHRQGVDAGTTQRALNAYMNNTREISDSQAEALMKLGVSLDVVYFASDKTAAKAKEFGIELSEGQRISEDMARELQGLGIEFDISAKLAGTQKEALAEMFETMASGEADVETMQAAIQIFGTRAGPEMLQALQSGTMGIEELVATLEGSKGVVAEASAVYDKQLGERWELIKRQYLEPFMETIGVALMNLLEYVLDKVEEWGPYIEAGFEFFQETIVPILNVFLDVAQNVFGAVGGLIETLVGIFTGDWDRALRGAQDTWESVWNGILAFIEGFNLVEVVKNVITGVKNFFIETVPKWFIEGGINIINAFLEGLMAAAKKIPLFGGKIADFLGQYLIGESPPPEGPLSEIDEGGKRVIEAWIEGAEKGIKDGVPALTSGLEKVKGLFTSIWDKVPEEIKGPIEQAMAWITDLIGQAEEALFKLDDLQDELERVITGGDSAGDQAEGFIAKLTAKLNEKLEALDDPLNRFVDMVSSAALHLGEVVKAIRSGDWVGAILSIIMETESFAKAMELIGKVMKPIVALFDIILRPIIEGLLKLWNGIIDALASISIFGWKPFEGLTQYKVSWDDDAGGGSGGRNGGTGGRQISEITGPTRDLLVDLLSPLANFGQIVAPIQDIRNILYERMPNFNALSLDFAGAGAIGGDIVFEAGAIVINSSGTSATELSRDMLDAIEREMARRVNFGIRGRGGR